MDRTRLESCAPCWCERPSTTRARRARWGSLRARPWRVVSCAELTTRSRPSRASRVVRAADDATSRGDERTHAARQARRPPRAPSELSSPGPHHIDPPAHRRPSLTPRVVRSAHDTRRTYARPKLPGPVRARLVSRAGARDASRHVQKREQRKPPRRPKATESRPNGTRPEKPYGFGGDALARRLANLRGFRGTCPVRRTRVQEVPKQQCR
jgi:hypothetical protein